MKPLRSSAALVFLLLGLGACGEPGSECQPSNCQGCCLAGICETGLKPSECGSEGRTCMACMPGQRCAQGQCVAVASGGGSGGASGGGAGGGGSAMGGGGGRLGGGAGGGGGTLGGGAGGGGGTLGGGAGGGGVRCLFNSDCPALMRCQLAGTTNSYCEPQCTFIGSAGCAAGTTCSFVELDGFGVVWASCGTFGTAGEGDPCTETSAGSNCRAELACIAFSASSNRCARKCDTAAPCPKSGQTCVGTILNNTQTGLKICSPALDACSPNPCFAAHQTTCTAAAAVATCSCDPGYGADGGVCTCVPQCSGRQCGSDSCGGTCGACASGQTCTAAAQCQCVPQCSGKQCGPDGCGGTCGACLSTQTCTGAGQCQCVPQCSGRSCGTDGCGGSCGACGPGQQCDGAGQCATCTPQCSGRSCGTDGCGGTCGSCTPPLTCTGAGACVSLPCSPVDQTGCLAGQRCRWSGTANTCTTIGPGFRGDPCVPDNCGAGLTCAGTASFEVCRKYCSTAANCGAGSQCVYTLSGTTTKLCSNACNPLSAGSCPGGQGCHVQNIGTGVEVADCGDLGLGGAGSSCSVADDCLGGFTCVSSTCRRLCGVGSSCTTGACASISGWTTYGVCPL